MNRNIQGHLYIDEIKWRAELSIDNKLYLFDGERGLKSDLSSLEYFGCNEW